MACTCNRKQACNSFWKAFFVMIKLSFPWNQPTDWTDSLIRRSKGGKNHRCCSWPERGFKGFARIQSAVQRYIHSGELLSCAWKLPQCTSPNNPIRRTLRQNISKMFLNCFVGGVRRLNSHLYFEKAHDSSPPDSVDHSTSNSTPSTILTPNTLPTLHNYSRLRQEFTTSVTKFCKYYYKGI